MFMSIVMMLRRWGSVPLCTPNPTIMLRVPITLENETTTPVGRVRRVSAVTRQKCIKNVGLRR
uniref:Uncharacterized protein n=1 Tax=Candidatus Kentrum sp. SD TaxID=2126332 RepID=A0A450Z0T7_9GAMM|nr:MAG: hypothetical protein BECKSD772F_GA0070984_10941 [Candidatus Kentron sp. SD]VFK47445.1 MAG: hypothetical protein BECKSD772E_GA0070983_10951 [Candidatus Kentron sp. SD]